MSSVKIYFQNLNLFEQSDDTVDRENEHERRSNMISTRVYLIVLPIALIVIGFAFWLDPKTIIMTIESPSQNQFEGLPTDAHCPCSHMSISYREFTTIESSLLK